MSGEPDSLVLNLLRAIRGDVGKLSEQMAEVKQRRLTTVEIQVGNLVASEQSHYAITMQRIDAVEGRLERIERRLDLVDAAPA